MGSLLILIAATPLRADDRYFYSGGKKHPLTPATDWIGVAAAPEQIAKVKKRVEDSGVLREKTDPVAHDRKGITVMPVEAGQAGNVNASLVAAGHRTVRVFRNGKADPIVETDDLVVRFKPEVTRNEADRMLAARGAVIVREIGNFAPNTYLARVVNGQPSTDN